MVKTLLSLLKLSALLGHVFPYFTKYFAVLQQKNSKMYHFDKYF